MEARTGEKGRGIRYGNTWLEEKRKEPKEKKLNKN
jgi:hypothetical protein